MFKSHKPFADRSGRLALLELALLLCVTTLGIASGAHAETVVYGRVVAVEPIGLASVSQPAGSTEDCRLRAPVRAAGLLARLRWDLEQRAVERSRCQARRVPERFRVTYRWNGQLFTQELPFDPGERIALRLDVR